MAALWNDERYFGLAGDLGDYSWHKIWILDQL
jgi:hypothetical protein